MPDPHDDTVTGGLGRIGRARQRAVTGVELAVERVPVLGTVFEASLRERATGGGLLAGGLAYRFFFWLVPLGLAAAAISKIFSHSGSQDLSKAAEGRGLAAAVTAAEREVVDASHTSPWLLLVIGIGFSVWFGIGVVRALTIVHSLAWQLPIRKVRRPPLAGAVFTLVAGIISIIGSSIGKLVDAVGLGPVALSLSMVAVYFTLGFGITAVFPHPRATPRALVPGSLLIGVGALCMHAFVNVYLAPKLGRSVDTYGMLGAATVILLWLFLIARLITVAAFLNAQIWNRERAERDVPPDEEPAQ